MAAHRLTAAVPLTPRPAPAATVAVFGREPVGDQIPAPHLRKRLPTPLMRKYLSYDVAEMAGLLRSRGLAVVELGCTRDGKQAVLSVMGDPYGDSFGVATVWLHQQGRIQWDTATASYQLPACARRDHAASQIAATLR